MIQEQQQAQQLFDVLFSGDDMVELRLLGHGVTPKSRFFDSPGMAIYDWEWITEKIEEGYNVYFGVNPRSERSGKAESIQYARCMFADFDDVADLDELKSRLKGLPPYSAIVHSGNGYHVYWKLTSRENDMKRWSYYQRGIIAHCKSDKAIHDPPRIMRLPGTINHKNGATCTVVELTGHTIDEDIAQVFPEPPNAKALYGTPDGQQAVLEGKCLPLSRRVEEWLHGDKPAQEGERHDVLVQASLEVVANGWPIEALERVVRRRAREDGLEDDEIDKVFEYALSKRGTLTPSLNNVPKEYEDAHTGETIEHRVRPRFSNVIRAKSQMDDGKQMDFFKPVDMVAEELKRGTGGWPALAKGVLFYPTGDENVPFRIISNCNQLFSYIFSATEPRWVSNKDLITPSSNELRSAITKQEFYEYLCNEMDDYRGIATLPHEPPMPGIWYAPVKLPEPSGRLDELIDRMNGETELDNQIIKAMFATPFWGGPCGARPMFVIRSRFGKATGKSTTADIAISLAGMAAEASAHEDWEKIARKLVGNTAMDGRIVRLDNVKGGRLSSGEMESAITAPEIEGHRMYKGSA
ncbi:MAG TPA: hypothetical protein VIG24_10330, partial [Acidimicrobiia bacterium]